MEAIRFKTTIKCSGCVAKVTPFLNEAVGETTWNVDHVNPEKILTVEGEFDRSKIISAVEKAGFRAEPLN